MDYDPGGGRSEGVGKFLQGGGTGGVAARAETWVLTPRMERSLDRFQHRVLWRITGKQPRIRTDGISDYPPLDEAMGEVGFEGIRKLVTRRQNKFVQYIATQPILDLCERDT